MTVARSFMIIWLHAMAISCGKLNIWFPYQTIGMNHCTSSNDLMFWFQCWNSKTRIFLRVLATYQLYVVLLLLSSCYSSPSSFLSHFQDWEVTVQQTCSRISMQTINRIGILHEYRYGIFTFVVLEPLLCLVAFYTSIFWQPVVAVPSANVGFNSTYREKRLTKIVLLVSENRLCPPKITNFVLLCFHFLLRVRM